MGYDVWKRQVLKILALQGRHVPHLTNTKVYYSPHYYTAIVKNNFNIILQYTYASETIAVIVFFYVRISSTVNFFLQV